MRRFRITLEYDVSGFNGWQVQAQGRTVQGVLEEALHSVTRERRRVFGAGRTDAGVHALGQVAHFDVETKLSSEELQRALNSVLPDDLCVRALEITQADFDARGDAVRKRYVYRILKREAASPLRRSRCWHLRGPLDLAAMRAAADALKGSHDFSAFRGAPGGAPANEETRRTLDVLEILEVGDELRVVAESRSFLRHMVRNLVGTLVDVGRGRLGPAQVAAILSAGSRAAAGPTAPAHGLCLEWILYGDVGCVVALQRSQTPHG